MAEQRALERIAQLAAKEEDEREQDARLETLRKSTRRRLGIGMDFFIFGRETLINLDWKQWMFENVVWGNSAVTGKSSSELLTYSSINPQDDNRLFNDLQVQYKKITRAEHVKNMLFTQIV